MNHFHINPDTKQDQFKKALHSGCPFCQDTPVGQAIPSFRHSPSLGDETLLFETGILLVMSPNGIYEMSLTMHQFAIQNVRKLEEKYMPARIARTISKHFDDEIKFFKTWIDKPKAMGAVLPTSTVTARRMASLIDPGTTEPVLELGPGTGVITNAILKRGVTPENLYSVEYTSAFIDGLREDFPGVNVLQGDAFDLDDVLPDLEGQKFNAIISAIPMLNFPVAERVELLNDLLDRLSPGRPVVQISYGPRSPVPPSWSNYTVEPLEWIARNIPPARLWVYRRVQIS